MTKHHHDKQHHEFDQESGKSETLENEVESAEENALQDLAQENQKLKDELLRALADSENIKKRCAAEIEKNSKYAISSFAKDLLGVADNLDRALQATQTEDNTSCQALLEGVKLTQKELSHVFEKFGITKMECIGQPFDPNFHQVIQQVSDPSHPAGTIITELQTGYIINGRILREAMVVVATE